MQARPKALTFINNYLHDSLASGISSKGADKIVAEGNVILRAGCKPIGADFDPYWWEVKLYCQIAFSRKPTVQMISEVCKSNRSISLQELACREVCLQMSQSSII